MSYVLVGSALLIVTVFVLERSWRLSPSWLRGPLFFYCGSYFVTYGVGAAWLGLSGSAYQNFMSEQWVPDIPQDIGALYWLMVFSPLILTPLAAFISSRFATGTVVASKPLRIELWKLWCLFLPCAAYAVWHLLGSGFLSTDSLALLFLSSGNTDVMYGLRQQLFDQFSGNFFALIYTVLPFLSFVAMGEELLFERRPRGGSVTMVVFVAISFVLNLLTLQGSVAAVYVIGVLSALAASGRIQLRLKTLLISGGVLLVFLQTYHFIKFGDLTGGVFHYFLRAPAGLAYYLWAYPGTLAHTGITLLGDLTGFFQPAAHHAFSIGTLVYAGDDVRNLDIQPAMPAPLHVNAYADAGVTYALFSLVLIGGAITLAGGLYRRSRFSSLAFGLAVQSLITLYYFTQVSLRDASVGSYGWIWACAAAFFLWILRPLKIG